MRKPTGDVAVFVYDIKIGVKETPNLDWPWLISAVFVNRGGQWIRVSRTDVRGKFPGSPPTPCEIGLDFWG